MLCWKIPVLGISFLLILSSSINSDALAQEKNTHSLYSKETFLRERFKMTMQDTESAYQYFKNRADLFIAQGDTVNYLHCIVNLSDIEKRKGQFNNAFDLLWDALPVATTISDKDPLIEIHHLLGILYGIYGKDSIALSHTMQAHQIAIEYVQNGRGRYHRLVSSYLDVAVQFIEIEEYEKALTYLDSCYIVDTSEVRLYFVDGFYGQVYVKIGEFEKAKKYLNGVIPYLEGMGNGFQTYVFYYLAELKAAVNEPDSALFYYNKSLVAIDSLQANLELKPVVLEKLSSAYYQKNDNKKAFLYMQEAKSISDSLFNTQSKHNQALFEIKNKYKEDLVKKEEQILAQNKLLELNKKARFRLKLLIGILILLAGIAIITIRLISKMKRMAYEQSINKEKNEAILEVKNKELTANALQIIEKEQTVQELLETIKENSPDEFKTLNRKYKQNNKKLWEDFNLRFTKINDKFYGRLLEKHPTLTTTDLKHCALIRLNFDSKEMSHLLGISINSVHMARSRIRKKLNLQRDESLSGFIAKI